MSTQATKFTLTIKEVSEIMRISKTKAYELVKSNKFPVIQQDRLIRIPAEPFFKWMNQSTDSTNDFNN